MASFASPGDAPPDPRAVPLRDKRTALWPYFIPLALAATLWFWDLGGRCFWNDEVLSVIFARLPAADIARGIDPYNPPLYFLGLKAWRALVGEDEAFCRAPSVVAALAGLALLIRAARDIGGARAGWLTGFLGAASPALLLYARECRAYPFLFLWSAGGLLSWLRLGRASSRSAVFAHAAWLALGPLIHYTAVLWWLAQACAAALPAGRRVVPAARSVFALALAVVFLLPVCSVLAPAAAGVLGLAGGRDLVPIGGVPARIAYVLFGLALGETILPWRWYAVVPAGLVCAIAVCSFAIHPRATVRAAIPALLLCLLTPLLLCLSSKPAPRYATVALPSFLLLVGLGLSSLPYRAAVAAALFVPMSLGAVNYFAGLDFHNMAILEPHRLLADELRTRIHIHPAETLLFAGNEGLPTQFYLPHEPCAYIKSPCPSGTALIASANGSLPLHDFLRLHFSENQRLWVVLNSLGQDPYPASLRDVREQLRHLPPTDYMETFRLKLLYDPTAKQKGNWVEKEFLEWRLEAVCYVRRE